MRTEIGDFEREFDVLAAGGLVVSDGAGDPRIAVIHRPKYADWTLPKGKLEPGEEWEEAALREVAEETGYACRLGDELEPAHYLDRKGRSKVVRYWLMHPMAGEFAPSDEVDELRWVDPAEALHLLTYDHDRRLVEWLRS